MFQFYFRFKSKNRSSEIRNFPLLSRPNVSVFYIIIAFVNLLIRDPTDNTTKQSPSRFRNGITTEFFEINSKHIRNPHHSQSAFALNSPFSRQKGIKYAYFLPDSFVLFAFAFASAAFFSASFISF